MSDQKNAHKPLVLGYWDLRARVQVIRLVLQYYNIPYVQQTYTPLSWFGQKKQKISEIGIFDLPYLIDGETIITEPISILIYITKKYSNGELLGKNYKQQAYVEMYLWFMDKIICKFLTFSGSKKDDYEIKKQKQRFWITELEQVLYKLQNLYADNYWCLNSLSIIDFIVYQLTNYVELLYPNRINNCFSKLNQIKFQISQLPSIYKYQHSNRSHKKYLLTETCSKNNENCILKAINNINR